MQIPAHRPLIVWRLTDGKPGHEKQTLGLANALARRTPVQRHDLPVPGGLWAWVTGRFPQGDGLPDPDLILAAGHATHFPALAARRTRGGRVIMLMRPSLPLAWFDLCLIPAHDNPPTRANVITTRGALNSVVPSPDHDLNRGLILVGGPSAHFRWDAAEVVQQIGQLLAAQPEIRWTLTTSRRTPADFLARLAGLPIELLSADATPAGWLEAQLSQAGQAWITPDSVSMVYEVLTAGCRVGVFELGAIAGSRVARGLADLRQDGYVLGQPDIDPARFIRHSREGGNPGMTQRHWIPGPSPRTPIRGRNDDVEVNSFRINSAWPQHPQLNEAERCAALILDPWFNASRETGVRTN